jgi:lipopolysaccharide/colanic/teichoic acid biosynthesis glycosyltransferase
MTMGIAMGDKDASFGPIGRDDGWLAKLGHCDGRLCRAFDLLAATTALLFFLPLLAILVVAVKLLDPGPVLFRHRRIGKNGRYFHCYKLRTMVVDADARLKALLQSDPAASIEWARDQKLANDPRITPLGRFLRKSSLDELPQFINILKGEMSLVGPRPIVDAEVSRYGRYFSHYTQSRPGLTGLWQVSGRSNTTYRRRVAMDVYYARRRSLGMNARIALKTVPAVLQARGSS